MLRKLLLFVFLMGFSFLSIPDAKAAGTITGFQLSNIIIDPSTTCDTGYGFSTILYSGELMPVGIGDTVDITIHLQMSSGFGDIFGPLTRLVNTNNPTFGYATAPPTNQSLTVTYAWVDNPAVKLVLVVNCDGTWYILGEETDNGPAFRDGRINLDPGQHASVYCRDNGIDVYYGNSQHFFVPQEEIDAVPAEPTENTLIASNGEVFLYRLVGGYFQMNLTKTPNPGQVYGVRWDTCQPTVVEPFEFYP